MENSNIPRVFLDGLLSKHHFASNFDTVYIVVPASSNTYCIYKTKQDGIPLVPRKVTANVLLCQMKDHQQAQVPVCSKDA
jgi:hypothetical protein